MRLMLLMGAMLGCRSETKPIEEVEDDQVALDNDGDGYIEDDCDDNDANVHPGKEELCDGLDNDCDGDIDEEVQDLFYIDADGDGFGDESDTQMACDSPMGYVPNGNDCDDQDTYSFPGAIEFCDDVDNDCDGEIDEEVTSEFYLDADGDGIGDSSVSVAGCDAPEEYVSEAGDCDDQDAYSYPGAVELCDDVDNDCDGEIDEDSAANVFVFYLDDDGDGAGDVNFTAEACAPPEGYVFDATDCDDSDPAINPDATEVCDAVDNDCDGDVDDDDSSLVGAQTWYLDHDGDTFGDSTYPMQACNQPSGYVVDSTDCNDLSAVAFPGGAEICDGLDNDCDGSADDADTDTDPATMETFYEDFDTDGYGSNTSTVLSCNAPAGYISDSGDCDDSNIDINPGANEQCDSADNDCDGQTDEPSAIDASVWYLDHDGDTFGDAGFQMVACDAPTGYVSDDTDCNDLDAAINSLAIEICDSVDNDCDGDTDDADANVDLNTGTVWYADVDQDGYGDASSTTVACALPVGYSADDLDCNDGDIDINPGATEECDGIDTDCSGVADDDPALYGLDYECAALSCDEIHTENPTYQDGMYWIDPDGNGAVTAYCNMSLAGGGWTLVGKFTNQDGRSWANSAANWVGYNNFGNTTNLNDGADAKSELWYRMVVEDFLLNDHLNPTDYVHTDAGCIGGNSLADYFTQALSSFPYSSANYYQACTVQFTNHPNWGLEPNWNNQIDTSPNLGLNASGRIAIAKTDDGGDTSGIISFYEADDPMEADVGLGALENGTAYTNDAYSQDIGGPTSCGYSDATCAADYPETVFFWVR